MRDRRLLGLSAVVIVLAACGRSQPPIANDQAVAGGEGSINLEQGWSPDVQQRASFTSFGSRLIPSAWLRVLEQAGNRQRFMEDANMDALGFLVQTPSADNPDGFPVGFTEVADGNGGNWTGLGCAACHTGEVRYKGHRIRLDGGQGVLDFDAFEGALIDSLQATIADDAKFARFADALGAAADQRADL